MLLLIDLPGLRRIMNHALSAHLCVHAVVCIRARVYVVFVCVRTCQCQDLLSFSDRSDAAVDANFPQPIQAPSPTPLGGKANYLYFDWSCAISLVASLDISRISLRRVYHKEDSGLPEQNDAIIRPALHKADNSLRRIVFLVPIVSALERTSFLLRIPLLFLIKFINTNFLPRTPRIFLFFIHEYLGEWVRESINTLKPGVG